MNLPSPDTLINRELGILEFQRRVLAQADDPNIPLLERLKFICIFSSNLDEFFEVRVAGLKEQIRAFFFRELMPVLTPVGLDPSHPFPRVLNKSLNFAVELSGRDAFGRNSGAPVVQAP